MPAEGLPVIPRHDLLTASEIARLVGLAALQSLRRARGALHRRGAADPARPGRHRRRVGAKPRPASRSPSRRTGSASTPGGRARRRRVCPASTSRSTPSTAPTSPPSPGATGSPAVLAGIEAAIGPASARSRSTPVAARDPRRRRATFSRWAIGHGCRLRFIEQMPLDADETWRRDNLVSAEELLAVLGPAVRAARRSAATTRPPPPRSGWWMAGLQTVGIIASVTRVVLRRLRPHAHHRRGHGAVLPVRRRRDRPAVAPARRCAGCRARRSLAVARCGTSRRGTIDAADFVAAGAVDGGDRWLRPAPFGCGTSPPPRMPRAARRSG